eukprot:5326348-Prymnesium_polylepis.1
MASERLGDDDQYEHCGILSISPSCASGIDTADRAAPTIAIPPSSLSSRYDTIAGDTLRPVSYMLLVRLVRFAVSAARPGTTASTRSLTWLTASSEAQTTCFHVYSASGTPMFVWGRTSPR